MRSRLVVAKGMRILINQVRAPPSRATSTIRLTNALETVAAQFYCDARS
jgi:hypothetical protein